MSEIPTVRLSILGRRSSRNGNMITLENAADASRFALGSRVTSSQGPDGANPRFGCATVTASNPIDGTVEFDDPALIVGFSDDDYLVAYTDDPGPRQGAPKRWHPIVLPSQNTPLVSRADVAQQMLDLASRRAAAGDHVGAVACVEAWRRLEGES